MILLGLALAVLVWCKTQQTDVDKDVVGQRTTLVLGAFTEFLLFFRGRKEARGSPRRSGNGTGNPRIPSESR